MNFITSSLLLFITIIFFNIQIGITKKDHEYLQIQINTPKQRSLFKKFETNSSINYETFSTNSLLAANEPHTSLKLKSFLYESRIPFKEISKKQSSYRNMNSTVHRLAYANKHMSYKQILKLLIQWRDIEEEDYKDKLDILEIGITLKNRPIVIAKLTDQVSQSQNTTKKSIFIEAGIHAREWATIDTVLYLMSEMMFESYYKEALKKYIFHFLVVANPDGYIYSHEQNRWWRKNLKANKKSGCLGIDLNRNFAINFGSPAPATKSCSDDYKGTSAFSEKESQAERDYLDELIETGNKIDLFLAFNSYGQQLAYPFGYSKKKLTNWQESHKLLKEVSKNLETYNAIDYLFGQTYFVIYPASGGSDDWVAYRNISRFVFVMELRDKGDYGFFIPEDQIENSALDGLVALNTMLNHLSPGVVPIKKSKK